MKNTKKFQAKNKGVRAWVCVYVCFFHPRYQGQFYVSFFFLSIIIFRPWDIKSWEEIKMTLVARMDERVSLWGGMHWYTIHVHALGSWDDTKNTGNRIHEYHNFINNLLIPNMRIFYFFIIIRSVILWM